MHYIQICINLKTVNEKDIIKLKISIFSEYFLQSSKLEFSCNGRKKFKTVKAQNSKENNKNLQKFKAETFLTIFVMKSSKVKVLNDSSKSTSSPSTPLFKRQRRIIDETPLSQNEVSWHDVSSDIIESETASPQRQVSVRAKSSNLLVQTPVRVVKRHVSSPAIGAAKIKNRFSGELESLITEEELELKKEDSFSVSSDEFDFSDDQLEAVLKKVDEEEQLKKQNDAAIAILTQPTASTTAVVSEINFEDSFDDAILASIPLEELSKCCGKKNSVEIVYHGGLSQIVNEKSPAKVMSKNKSMDPVAKLGTKRPFERHSSLPSQQSSSSSSNNGKK